MPMCNVVVPIEVEKDLKSSSKIFGKKKPRL
jgi:hypothetical protein